MNKKILWTLQIFSLLILMLLMVACGSQEEEQVMPRSNPISDAAERAVEEAPDDSAGTEEETKEINYAPEVAELIAKSQKVASYQYSLKSLVKNPTGIFEESELYQAYVKGEKIRKVYLSPKKLNQEVFYNQVYLDQLKKTAYVICEGSGVLCEDQYNKAYKISYNLEQIEVTPLGLIPLIPASAIKAGEENLENRQAVILSYQNVLNQSEKLSLDDYSGLPLKQVIYILEDDEEVILEQNTFSLEGLNNVKNSDVTLPDRYEIVG